MVSFCISPDVFLRAEAQQEIRHYFARYHDGLPTEADFAQWLRGLPNPIRAIYIHNGLAIARRELSFRRYVLEVRGYSLCEHLRATLSAAAFDLWLESREYGTSLYPNQVLEEQAARFTEIMHQQRTTLLALMHNNQAA